MIIRPFSGTEILRRSDELSALLCDAVRHGASVGFADAPAPPALQAYWREVAGQVAFGITKLLAALDERGRLVGSAQLVLSASGDEHGRAEVQKLMVFAKARGRGVGAALMTWLEREARQRGRTLLALETGEASEGVRSFYRKLGFAAAETAGPRTVVYKQLAPGLS
jgi:acetyltransferase